MSGLFKPFGLQPRNTTLDSIREENVRSHQSTSITSVRSSGNVSTVSRTFGLGSENVRSLSTQNNRLNQDVRNNRSSFAPTSFGLQMRSLSTLRGIPLNDNSRFNQEPNIRNNRNTNEHFQTSNSSRIFGPAFRDTNLTNSLQVQEKYNDGVDTGGFRIPSIPRMIRGRNPITSSRIFSHHNIEKCKNLSNINGFDVSHISRRDMDTMSESRLGLMRSGWMDKQSVSGSMYSTSSVKAQAMNLLENLHYSILNMGPYLSVEAVTMEIEKAKQGLDNICEMSFAPSIKEADAVSIASHTSKYNCPENNDQTKNIINGECLNLKSSKEVLKSLAISNTELKSKMNLNETEKKSTHDVSKQIVDINFDEEESCLVFKKPKPFTKQKKSSKRLKIRTPPVKKPVTSKVTSRIINLKQWYPIAVGDDLALCGVDEHGVIATTDAMKKRISNRKVELINGFTCNLIGSPSSMTSVLPKSVASSIRNGLTCHWRVLQRKLINCQTVEEKKQKRKSGSPAKKVSPKKLQTPQMMETKTAAETDSAQKSYRKEVKKRKSPPKKSSSVKKTKSPARTENKKPPVSRVVSSPKKRGNGVRTRSGRAVKPPTMFWIVSGNNEIPALDLSFLSKTLTETPVVKKTKTTNPKRPEPKPGPKPTNEAQIVESHVVNSTVDVDESYKRPKPVPTKRLSKNKGKQPKKNKEEDRGKTKEASEVVKVVSSTVEKTGGSRAKRKRDPKTETETTQRKKSKIDSMEELQVESTVADTKVTTNNRKQKTTQNTKKANSPAKPKPKNQQQKKNETKSKKTAKGASANTSETKFVKEVEEDFELQLDDIEIPQFGNLSGNPQLSRSQLRLVSAETPPLKYFNSNLKVFTSTTPMRSPEWVISQRTESEVKQFQKRRAEAFKKKVEVKKTQSKKTVVREKTQSRDLKKVLEWVAEKTVQSPRWNSEVLQYVLPSRRQLEQQEQEEDDEDDEDDNEFP